MDKILQTNESFEKLLARVRCNLADYRFKFVLKLHNEVPYLQIVFTAPDSKTGHMEEQYCRKWVLQYTMSDSEVIRTAHMAASAAYDHERDEQFTFDGVAIYSPHTNLHTLRDMLSSASYNHDIRQEELTPFHTENAISQMSHEQFREIFEAALEGAADDHNAWATMVGSVLEDSNNLMYNNFLDRLKTMLANKTDVDTFLNGCLFFDPDYKTNGHRPECERFYSAIRLINEETADLMVQKVVDEASDFEVFYHKD